jgi:hypothetical protein
MNSLLTDLKSVLSGIDIKFLKCGVNVEVSGVDCRVLRHNARHVSVTDGRQVMNTLIELGHKAAISWNVFGIQ